MSISTTTELQVFLCPHQPGGYYVSRLGCAKQWRKANDLHQKNWAKEWNQVDRTKNAKEEFEASTLFRCVKCDIGKKNAQGESPGLSLVPVSSLDKSKAVLDFNKPKNGNSLHKINIPNEANPPTLEFRRAFVDPEDGMVKYPCCSCNMPFPRTKENFYKRPDSKDGLAFICKTCEQNKKKAARQKPKPANLSEPGAGKICKWCGVWKLLTEFNKDSEKKDGHASRCKICGKNKKEMSNQPVEEFNQMEKNNDIGISIQIIFEAEDKHILDRLKLLSKKERRSPDQQVLVLLERVLMKEVIGVEEEK